MFFDQKRKHQSQISQKLNLTKNHHGQKGKHDLNQTSQSVWVPAVKFHREFHPWFRTTRKGPPIRWSGLGALATLGAGSDGLRTVYSTFYGQILSFVFFVQLGICFFVSFVGLNELWLGEACVNQASKRLIAVVGESFSDSGCSPHTSQRRPGFKTFATLSAIPGSQATGDRLVGILTA